LYFIRAFNQTPLISIPTRFTSFYFALNRIWRRSVKSVTNADNDSERWPVAHRIGNHRRRKTEDGEQ